MWSYEHTVEASVTPEAVFGAWSKVLEWREWNQDIEAIEIDGPFAAGSHITMTPVGQDPVRLQIVDVVDNERFSDVAEFGGLVLRTLHLVQALPDGRSAVTYRMEITGDNADTVGAEIGPQITADFPETIESLVKHVGG